MFTRIALENFKAHASLDLSDIPPIAVVVGPNNIGKSAILQAAAIPRYGLSNEPGLFIGDWGNVVRTGATSAVVKLWQAGGAHPQEYRVGQSVPDMSQVSLPGGIIVPTWTNMYLQQRVQDGLWFRRFPTPSGNPISGFFPGSDSVVYVSALRGLPETFGHRPLDNEVGPRGQNTGNILHNLISSRDARFEVIERWAQEFGLHVSSIASQTVSQGQGVTWFRIGEVRTESTYVGSGTLAVLPVLVQGVLCSRGQTLLVEEPESHLHRGAMNGLWRFFQDCVGRGVQVIATSHSFDFLESLYRRAEAKQVDASVVRVVSLSSDDAGHSTCEAILPERILDFKDRIVRGLSEP